MRALDKALGSIATAAGAVGGIALVGLMLTTVVDVSLRSTLNLAFLGVTEITELGLVVVAICGIAYCGWTGGHIALELGERFVPPAIWRGSQIAVLVLSAVGAAAVAFYSAHEAIAVYSRSARTNLLQIAEYPFYAIVAFGFLIYTAILLVRACSGQIDGEPGGPRE
jgi:TRAP-type C4-dicarboxylate transport system permease small subunit